MSLRRERSKTLHSFQLGGAALEVVGTVKLEEGTAITFCASGSGRRELFGDPCCAWPKLLSRSREGVGVGGAEVLLKAVPPGGEGWSTLASFKEPSGV